MKCYQKITSLKQNALLDIEKKTSAVVRFDIWEDGTDSKRRFRG